MEALASLARHLDRRGGTNSPRWSLDKSNLCGLILPSVILPTVSFAGSKLTESDLSSSRFIGVDFSNSKLDCAQLVRANLSRCKLINANLIDTTLEGATLSKANLSGAILTNANLSGSDLSGANLTGACLLGADLSGTRLSRANLSGALLHTNNGGSEEMEHSPIRGLTQKQLDSAVADSGNPPKLNGNLFDAETGNRISWRDGTNIVR